MDAILNEIEQFQEETDNMVNNMENIEQLLVQAEQDNEEQKKGLTPEEIRRLKQFTYSTTNKKKGEEDICSVCLTNFNVGHRVFQLVCNHMFHQKCIKPWFEKSTQCPNCRRELQI